MCGEQTSTTITNNESGSIPGRGRAAPPLRVRLGPGAGIRRPAVAAPA